jgi:hypothetical protein
MRNEYLTVGPFEHFLANVLMTVTIVSTFILMLIQNSYGRDRVIRRLMGICVRTVKHKGSVHEGALRDIRYLGEMGASGSEKTQVLEALAEVIGQMQSQARYEGNGLPIVLQALEATLRTDVDATDLLYGVGITAKSIDAMQQRGLSSSPDMRRCLESLRRIGGMILELESDQDALAILQALQPVLGVSGGVSDPVARILFRLGATALSKGLYEFSARALNELESIWGRNPQSQEVSAAYFGLVAHFWSAGGSARERGRQSIDDMEVGPTIIVQGYLTAARKHHVMFARFETADRLAAMLRDVERVQRSPLLGLV